MENIRDEPSKMHCFDTINKLLSKEMTQDKKLEH